MDQFYQLTAWSTTSQSVTVSHGSCTARVARVVPNVTHLHQTPASDVPLPPHAASNVIHGNMIALQGGNTALQYCSKYCTMSTCAPTHHQILISFVTHKQLQQQMHCHPVAVLPRQKLRIHGFVLPHITEPSNQSRFPNNNNPFLFEKLQGLSACGGSR